MEEKVKYCTLYIVRHGRSTGNEAKIVAGHTDSMLAEAGEAEAQAKAEQFAKLKFDAVFSSDLIRAKRTAEIIAAEHQLAVNTTQMLRERNFGEWEGHPETEFLKANQELLGKIQTLSEQQKRDLKFGQGYESNNEIVLRMLTFLREIAATYLGQTVLIVSHGSIMRSLLMHLGFADYEELPAGSIGNTGHIVLESDGVDFFIKETFNISKINV